MYDGGAASAAPAALTVTGVAPNHSSAKIYYQPVAGAKDYRVYDIATPNDVKYAGLVHLIPSQSCPGLYCLNHFVVQADGTTPVFPYQVAAGASGGPQVLDVPATEIEWNSLGDGLAHTVVVEAVDQLGPIPQGNLYTGAQNLPMVNPMPSGAMLGSNKGTTGDGKLSTNGQGPYTNNPQVLAVSQPFVVQANQNFKAVPSAPTASQTFFDTFENGAAIKLLARTDSTRDSFNNLGSMTYSMNAGTPKAWTIEYRQADNINSMPFVASNHFMDMLFDGATPGTSAPTHTIYGSMSMTPNQTFDMSGGKVLHMTMEVDAHQSFRRWLDFNLVPASDPIQSWGSGGAINNSNQGIFLELKGNGCTLDIFTGPASASKPAPTGTAGGSAHGARLWGQAGSVGGAPIMCYAPYNPKARSDNGLGLDNRSRLDFFISQSHAALFEEGQLVVQSDIPAGSFPWTNVPLKAYYSHYVYHSDNDVTELQTVQNAGSGWCYPLNSYWFNNPLTGTAATQTVCNRPYPAGYGFPHSDERHWDNMGFEVLPSSVAATTNYSSLASTVQPPPILAPNFVSGGAPAPVATSTATTAPASTATAASTSTPAPVRTNTPTVRPTSTSTAPPTSTATTRPTNTPVPAATPTQKPAPASYTSTASLAPNTVHRALPVSISASVKSTTASKVVVDLEVYDGSGVKVFQRSWDAQTFTAGQTITFPTTWSVPATAKKGTYSVKVAVFSIGWGTLYHWNDRAATLIVVDLTA